jgi:hypothetical protein
MKKLHHERGSIMFLGNTVRFTQRELTTTVFVLIRAISESTKPANVAKLSELLHAIVVEQNPRIPSKLFTDCKYIVEGMDLFGIVTQHHHDVKEGYHKPLAQPVWSDIDRPYLGIEPKKASAIVRSGFNRQVVPKRDVMVTFVQDFKMMTTARKKHNKSYFQPYFDHAGTPTNPQFQLAEAQLYGQIRLMLKAYRWDILGTYGRSNAKHEALISKITQSGFDEEATTALRSYLQAVGVVPEPTTPQLAHSRVV